MAHRSHAAARRSKVDEKSDRRDRNERGESLILLSAVIGAERPQRRLTGKDNICKQNFSSAGNRCQLTNSLHFYLAMTDYAMMHWAFCFAEEKEQDFQDYSKAPKIM